MTVELEIEKKKSLKLVVARYNEIAHEWVIIIPND